LLWSRIFSLSATAKIIFKIEQKRHQKLLYFVEVYVAILSLASAFGAKKHSLEVKVSLSAISTYNIYLGMSKTSEFTGECNSSNREKTERANEQ